MVIFFLIVGLIVLLVCLFFILRNKRKVKKMLWAFKHCNVIVFGPIGTGKDLVFQYVIKKRKDRYFSNLNYGYDYKHIDIKDLSVYPNTYQDFISGLVTRIKKDNKREGHDVYISDGGVYLPSQYDTTLNKTYPSFSVYYALSRHLYNSHTHVNTQNLERIWKTLREQSDYYVNCIQTIKLPFFLITRVCVYDRYDSACRKIKPIKVRRLNKFSKSNYDLYNANNGDIFNCFIIQSKRSIKYDTRYFHKKLFGRKFVK